MNMNRFVPSEYIREFYDEIGFEMSAEQAAYVIFSNEYSMIEDKWTAWQSLIDSTDDIRLKERVNGAYTLHELLLNYIEHEKDELQLFTEKSSNAVYILYSMGRGIGDSLGIYGSFYDCVQDAERYTLYDKIDDEEIWVLGKKYKCVVGGWPKEEYKDLYIRKQWYGDKNRHMMGFFGNGPVLSSISNNCRSPYNDTERFLRSKHKGIIFPFKKGDILKRWNGYEWIGEYVFSHYSDSSVYCYTIRDDGAIRSRIMCNPFCLSVFSDNVQTITHSLSEHVKGERDLADFLEDYDEQRIKED